MGQQLILPPLPIRVWEIALQYNLTEKHVRELWRKFIALDRHKQGFWTVENLYHAVNETPDAMLSPFLEALFQMADASGEGALTFDCFVQAFTSFCALSREEMLQFVFIVLDIDRNGRIGKEELFSFFSYCGPQGAVGSAPPKPVFPVNNKNALDKFNRGRWQYLDFDELAQLSEHFPYISYPAFKLQALLRSALIGSKFWDNWDAERLKIYYLEAQLANATRTVTIPTGEEVEISQPGRFTMKEVLEYSRRKSQIHNGRRVAMTTESLAEDTVGVTRHRDEMLSRTPILNVVLSPRSAYHVPYIPPKKTELPKRGTSLKAITNK